MRIRRNIIAPAILTICTVGSLVAGPVFAFAAAAMPASASVGAVAKPGMISFHG